MRTVRPEKATVVTLLCNLEDASKLTLAASDGRIQLVLRNPTDTLKSDSNRGVGRRSLYGITPPPTVVRTVVRRVVEPVAPPPPPPPPPAVVIAPPVIATIEIVSGGHKSVVQIGNPPTGPGDNR